MSGQLLQVVYAWGRHLLAHRLIARKQGLSVGPTKRADMVTPRLAAAPRKLKLLAPIPGGYRVHVVPGMTGWIETRTHGKRDMRDILAEPTSKRSFAKSGHRYVDVQVGDCAVIGFDDACALRVQLSFVDPHDLVPRPRIRDREPLLIKTVVSTIVTLGLLVALLMVVSPAGQPEFSVEITKERFAKILEPVLNSPTVQKARDVAKKEGERKKKEKEAAMSKKMKDKEGKLGRQDAKGETTLPKADKDVLREKVAKVGVLSILGTARAGGSGLGKLLDANAADDLDSAVTGLAGARLAVGHGSGGVGNGGTGLGGGGQGFGRIQGSGGLNLGAGRGRGLKGSGVGNGKEREVQVGVDFGDPDAEGGLTKEQVDRVVRAHKAALKYCYEKELQRRPNLEGKVDLAWMIKANGDVERVRIALTTLSDKTVESCMQRQVTAWKFPKASAPTLVQRYPFLFKGGT